MYKETRLGDRTLDEVLKVANLAFDHFYSRSEIMKRLSGKGYYLVIEKEKNVHGFVLGYPQEDIFYCWLMAVHPEHRRKGIGKDFMNLCIERAKELGKEKVSAKTHAGHPAMISLLKKLGFKETKREKRHWGDDREAIFYEKSI